MKINEKPRSFEYSSLVMGSKDIPLSAFSTKRPSVLTSAKIFTRKSDLVNAKYSKMKGHKIKTRNQRPDIFLEGEQLAKNTSPWQHEVDIRYLEDMKDKLRKSTPNTFVKSMPRRKTPAPRSTATCADFEQQSNCAYILTFPRRQSNTVNKVTNAPQHVASNRRIYSTQRNQSASKDSPTRRELQIKLDFKIQQKNQMRLNETLKGDLSKRKQLFYLTQRDLSCIKSQSFIVTQHPNNQIVTGYYYKKVAEIASLTKIMTFYVVDRLLQQYSIEPSKVTVKIDQQAAEISGTSAELLQGDQYTVQQLLYGLMLPSGNDAATALAKWGGSVLGGEKKDFIAMMNKTATQIGMKSSSFGNPHGLPHPHNGSTAEDVSILVSKCLQSQMFKTVVKCKQYRCWIMNQGVKREVVWENTNKLLRRAGFQGVKTGVTVTAGPCLATLYSTKGRTFIVVVLRTNKLSRRFKQTRWLLKMCLKRMNFDCIFNSSIRELSFQDAQFDSDNSEQEEEFNFDRTDAGEMDRRRRIIINQL